jgi:release factor glutamine methyltransferase
MVRAGRDTIARDRASLERSAFLKLGSRHEAKWIIDEIGGSSATLTPEEASRVEEIVDRRAAGAPLQYLLGHWPFRSIDLTVDERALIPRPETEWVTEIALGELDQLVGAGVAPTVVDLGTGTGAIALSIATERAGDWPDMRVIATDRDQRALDLARLNRQRVSSASPLSSRVEFRPGWWFDALEPSLRGQIALVVSNPPYVAESEWADLDAAVRDYEPRVALVARDGRDGTPGLADLETIVHEAPHWLARPGTAVLEIAATQARATLSVAQQAGCSEAVVQEDLAGRPRVLVARWR